MSDVPIDDTNPNPENQDPPETAYDFTTTELDALAAAFDPDEGWKWHQNAIEPDARIQVLISETVNLAAPKFLVRHQHGWVWASGAEEAAKKRETQTPYTWKAMVSELVGMEYLRVPTTEELIAGSWTIEETGPAPEESLPVPTQALLDAVALLRPGGDEVPGPHEVAEAAALALTSIAASVHDLAVLLGDELEWRRHEREPGTAIEEDVPSQDESAHRSTDLPGGEDFPFAVSPQT